MGDHLKLQVILLNLTTIQILESPPKLGEHTNEILKGFLDKTDEEISNLRQNKIIN